MLIDAHGDDLILTPGTGPQVPRGPWGGSHEKYVASVRVSTYTIGTGISCFTRTAGAHRLSLRHIASLTRVSARKLHKEEEV